MQLVRWEPFRDVANLQQTFDKFFPDRPVRTPKLSLDAYETEDALTFEAAVPGATKESFTISYKDQFLTITANLGEPQLVEGARYHLKERISGEVSRTLRLPFPVDADRGTARYADGILTLTLPKTENHKPKSIPVE